MSVILNIDTAQESAFVCISIDSKPVYLAENHSQQQHASFLHQAIDDLIKKSELSLHTLDAIAVTKGPGSYTGLRVGMSAAKGLAYALGKPLLTISTLELMAHDVINSYNDKKSWVCPMIDARRMEVFAAVYDSELNEISSPSAIILENNSFDKLLLENTIYFNGSGSEKFQQICNHKNAKFIQNNKLSNSMSVISQIKFDNHLFNDIVESEPDYIKPYKAF